MRGNSEKMFMEPYILLHEWIEGGIEDQCTSEHLNSVMTFVGAEIRSANFN